MNKATIYLIDCNLRHGFIKRETGYSLGGICKNSGFSKDERSLMMRDEMTPFPRHWRMDKKIKRIRYWLSRGAKRKHLNEVYGEYFMGRYFREDYPNLARFTREQRCLAIAVGRYGLKPKRKDEYEYTYPCCVTLKSTR